MIPLRRRKRRGGEERCIVFRGSKICRPLILFSDWKMRQRTAKDEKGGKRRRGKQNKYLNAVQQKSPFPPFSPSVAHATTVKIERLPPQSARPISDAISFLFSVLGGNSLHPIICQGAIRVGRDKLLGCTDILFEFSILAPSPCPDRVGELPCMYLDRSWNDRVTGKSRRDGVVMWDADCIFPSRHSKKFCTCTEIDCNQNTKLRTNQRSERCVQTQQVRW